MEKQKCKQGNGINCFSLVTFLLFCSVLSISWRPRLLSQTKLSSWKDGETADDDDDVLISNVIRKKNEKVSMTDDQQPLTFLEFFPSATVPFIPASFLLPTSSHLFHCVSRESRKSKEQRKTREGDNNKWF